MNRSDHGLGLSLPVRVSEQLSLLLNKAFTNHQHPLLLQIG